MPIFPIVENFMTNENFNMWELLLKTIAIGVGKAVTFGEYEKIKNESKHISDYNTLIALLQAM
jgi:hypothetical protein